MSIKKRVKEVEDLYQKLDLEIASFQASTKLSCLAGCGKCCANPEIDASPLEFLPYAYHLFLNGKAQETLDKLNSHSGTMCAIYQPHSLLDDSKGSCSEYKNRGLICRLFGYGASKNKYEKLQLVTCKLIRENQTAAVEQTNVDINNGLGVPVFTDYYMNLSQIDFRLGNIILPINKALAFALEEVLQYYAYRELPNELCC